jgi:hypothetical protein
MRREIARMKDVIDVTALVRFCGSGMVVYPIAVYDKLYVSVSAMIK